MLAKRPSHCVSTSHSVCETEALEKLTTNESQSESTSDAANVHSFSENSK